MKPKINIQDFIRGSIGTELQGLTESSSPYIEVPVDIKTFVLSPEYMDAGNTTRPAVLEDLVTIFQRDSNGKIKYHEIVFDEGKGSGKCISGNEEIVDLAQGKRYKICDAPETVTLMAKDGKLRKATKVYSGQMEVGELLLLSGKKIKCTPEHLFYVGRGWKSARDLTSKDLVATPRKLPYSPNSRLTRAEALLAAYMIADGNCTQNYCQFCNEEQAIIREFEALALEIGCAYVYKQLGKSKATNLIPRSGRKWGKHPLYLLMTRLGLKGLYSYEKRLPDELLFSNYLAEAINRLWGCDGCIEENGLSYSTSNYLLASDMITALLMFGIHATLRCKKTQKRDAWILGIYGQEVLSFSKFIGAPIGKRKKFECLLSKLESKKRNPNRDVVPFVQSDINKSIQGKSGYRKLHEEFKTTAGDTTFLGIEKLTRLATYAKTDYINQILRENEFIYWDKVVSFTMCGVADVYDFSVPDEHNFVANNIIVHNSYKSSVIATYLVYGLLCYKNPQKHFPNLSQGSKIAIMNMSLTGTQAKDVVFGQISARVAQCKWFKKHGFEPDTDIKSVLRFPKDIYVIPGSSKETAPAGYDIIAGIMDEAAWYTDIEAHDVAEEIYYSLQRSSKSRFIDDWLLIMISSPRYTDDFIERKGKESETNPEIFFRRRPCWRSQMPGHYKSGKVFSYGPYDDIPIELKSDFDKSPMRALRDYGAIPSLVLEPFFEEYDRVVGHINFSRIDPLPELVNELGDQLPESPREQLVRLKSMSAHPSARYFIHVDLATGGEDGMGCRCGFCMGHIKTVIRRGEDYLPIGCIDLMTRFRAAPSREIQFDEVRDFVLYFHGRGFHIEKCTFDGWESIDSRQILTNRGVPTDKLSIQLDAYSTMKEMMYEGRLDYYNHQGFLQECQRLELKKGKSVEKPRNSTKDLSDCVAGVCYHMAESLLPGNKKRPRRFEGRTMAGVGTRRTSLFDIPKERKTVI